MTGVHETLGAVAERYLREGAEGGPLGFPVTGNLALARGAATRFENGRISWLPAAGAAVLREPLAAAYARAGNETGPLGFPVADAEPVAGGQAQRFESGRVSAGPTGAYWLSRRIAETYVGLGAEQSVLGFPVDDEREERDWPWKSLGNRTVRVVHFERGSIAWDVAQDEVVVTPAAV